MSAVRPARRFENYSRLRFLWAPLVVLIVFLTLFETRPIRPAHADSSVTVGCTGGVGDIAVLASAVTNVTVGSSGTITLGTGCTYTFTSTTPGPLTVAGNVTIVGNGATITGAANSAFKVNSGASLNLGGVMLTGNANPTGGGAIFSRGVLTIQDSTVSNNQVTYTAGNQPLGGAILATGPVTITRSVFAGNTAGAQMTLGGAIYTISTVAVSDSTFTGNHVSGSAGAIYLSGTGASTISNSTFDNNYVTMDNGGAGYGGAVLNQNGPLTVTNSTFSGNRAQGGAAIYNQAATTIVSSTFGGNTTNDVSNGGAVYTLSGGSTTIGGSLFAGNINNNGDTPPSHAPSSCAGSLGTAPPTDNGANVSDDATCGFTAGNHSVPNSTTIGLKALADNGGATQTMAILSTSSAYGIATNCPTTDQRGATRLSAGETTCDAGAYEANAAITGATANVTVTGIQTVGGATNPVFNFSTSDSVTNNGLTCARVTTGASIDASLPAGSYTIDGASCSGLAATNTADALVYTGGAFNVTAADTDTVLSASPASPTSAQQVTFTATVTSEGSPLIPIDGTVTFKDGATVLCSAQPVARDSSALTSASCIVPSLTAGLHDITAAYTGGSSHNDSSDTATLASFNVSAAGPISATCGIQSLADAITTIGASTGTISLSAGCVYDFDAVPALSPLNIIANANITIEGNGATIQNANKGAFLIASGATLNLDSVTLANNFATTKGGAIANAGTLTISNSTLSRNQAVAPAGAIGSSPAAPGSDATGGAIDSSGSLTITNSMFLDNDAFGGNGANATGSGDGGAGGDGSGGAIHNSGTLSITNSTFAGNLARGGHGGYGSGGGAAGPEGTGVGGAISQQGTATLTNVTISGNHADYGGGIYEPSSSFSATVNGVVLAMNIGSNCYGGSWSGSYNLSDDGNCTAVFAGNVRGLNLGALANNGGPTQTMAITSTSAAYGIVASGCPATDQRGATRNTTNCDAGAYEANAPIPGATVDITVTGGQDAGSTSPSFSSTVVSPHDAIVSGTVTCATVNGGSAISSSLAAGSSSTIDGGSCSGLSVSAPSTSYAVVYTGGAFQVTGTAPSITSAAGTSFDILAASGFTITTTGTPTAALTESGTLPTGVGFTDNGDGTATLGGTPATGTAGSYPITIKASNGVSPDASQSFTLTVTKLTQTVSFTSTAPTNAVVGGTAYTPAASATSNLPVAFTIDPSASAVCEVSGSTVSFTGIGQCVIDANQGGNGTYAAAPQVQQSFAVAAGVTSTTTTVTSSAGSAGAYTSAYNVPFILTATVTPDPTSEPGSVTFEYSANSGGSWHAIIGTSSCAGQPLTSGSGDATATCTLSDDNILANTLVASTTPYQFRATYADSASVPHFTSSTSAAVSQTITKAVLSPTVTISPSTISYGGLAQLTAGGLSVFATGTATFVDSNDVVLCTANLASSVNTSCDTSATLAASSYTGITAKYSGDSNFSAASSSNTVGLTVLAHGTITTLTASPNPGTAGESVTLTATVAPGIGGGLLAPAQGTVTFYDGVLSISNCSGVPVGPNSGNTATIATCITSSLAAGPHTLNAIYAPPAIGADYASSNGGASLIINKLATTITAAVSPATVTYGATASLSVSGLPTGATGSVTFSDDTTTFCRIADITAATSCTTSISLDAGSYSAIAASYSGDSIYSASTSSNTVALTVAQATITVTVNGSQVYDGTPTLTHTTSGGTVTGDLAGCSSLEVTGNGITLPTLVSPTLSAASGYTLTVSGCSGLTTDANHSISYVGGTFDVSKAAQSITFTSTAPTDATVGGTPYTVAATGGGSGNAVTFSIDAASSGICSISGSSVSFTAVGTCIVLAGQAGDADYSAAEQVSQSFAISRAPVSVTVSGSQTFGGSPSFTYTAADGVSGTVSCTTVDGGTAINATLGVGTHTIDASSCTGPDVDANHALTLTGGSFVVNAVSVTVLLQSSPNPSVYGQPFAITATVTADGVTAALGGSVQFFIDGVAAHCGPNAGATSPSAVDLDSSNTATCVVDALNDVAGLHAGDHTLTANYVPGSNANATSATATPITQVVVGAPTTIVADAAFNNFASGAVVTITATITAGTSILSPAHEPGSIMFYNGATPLCTVSVSDTGAMSCTVSISPSAVSPHSLTVVYTGAANGDFLGSQTTADVVPTLASPTLVSIVSVNGMAGRAWVIQGGGFSGATVVTVCGQPVAFTVVNDSVLFIGAPGVPGPQQCTIVVTAAGGTGSGGPLTVLALPVGGTGGGSPSAGGGPVATAPSCQATLAQLTLMGRWSLIAWPGATMGAGAALAGNGSPCLPDISSRIAAIWSWDAASGTWHAYFPGVDIPGVNDLTTLQRGNGYFVALSDPSAGSVTWTVVEADD